MLGIVNISLFYLLCNVCVNAVKLDQPPDVIYDMTDSFDLDGSILDTNTIYCDQTKSFDEVNFDYVNDSNHWFKWDTTSNVQRVTVSVEGDSNNWLYFIYDADEDASEGFLTISSLIEICYQCGIGENNIDIDLTDDDFSRGRYWIGADGQFTVTTKCDYLGFEIEDDEIAIISSAITIFALLIFTCLAYSVYHNRTWDVYGKDEILSIPLCPPFSCNKKDENEEKVTNIIEIKNNMLKEIEVAKNITTLNEMHDMNDGKKKEMQSATTGITRERRETEIMYDEYFEIIENICDNGEGLDAYQVLAFRLRFWADPPQFAFRFSKVQIAVFVAFMTSILQTYGITITLRSVVYEYFIDEEDGSIHQDAECEWQEEVWAVDGEYKVLAFVWSVVISLSVAIYASETTQNGLNRLIGNKELSKKELLRINEIVDIQVLQFGVLVNLYALLMAILGSFFLIYKSEGGAESLDMILNAVALYFMIELDDMLVSEKEYEDLKKHLKWLQQTPTEEIDPKDAFYQLLTTLIYKFSIMFRYLVLISIAILSFVAPFVILTCW